MAITTNELQKHMQSIVPHMQKVLPKHLTAERMLNIGVVAASRNPLLLECDPRTILRCMVQASMLGLEPDTPLGLSYLVPFKNGKTGQYECQLITGYRGMIELARRSGNIQSLEAHVVYEGDQFAYELGLAPKLSHVPNMVDGTDNIIASYAIAKLVGGGIQFEVMSRKEIDAIRLRSKASKYGPWVTDYSEMARKTVVRRLAKYLPLSIELANALDVDNSAETGQTPLIGKDLPLVELGAPEVIDAEPEDAKAAEILAKIK